MKRIHLALAVAALTCGACNAGGGAREGVDAIEVATAQRPANVPTSSAPPGSPASPTTGPASSAVPSDLDGCPIISPDRLDGIVARAIGGLDDTSAEDGWSHACAWLTEVDGSGEPSLLTIRIAWWGSLNEYSGAPGAKPIAGLADEAYALDAGDRIALRSGEVVAIVSYSGETAATIGAFAQQVAGQLPE